MRVVVTGASGNTGTALLERLSREPGIESVLGICRRRHDWRPAKTEWRFADVAEADLVADFREADAVVHLAWLFHPVRHAEATWHNNVTGTDRVLRASAEARVPAVVVASSVGAYSPRRDLSPVDESWPTHGWANAAYSREKAFVERLLDLHAVEHPDRRVVRLRSAFIFQRRSAVQQRRLFAGPFVPHAALRPGVLPVLPFPAGLRLQAVHAEDIAEAYTAALLQPVTGAYNVAAGPVLGAAEFAELLRSRSVTVPDGVARSGVAAAFHSHLTPASPGLFELALRVPMMSAQRAREQLGWSPRRDALAAVAAFLDGLVDGAGGPTPPLDPRTSGRLRGRELAAGVGTGE